MNAKVRGPAPRTVARLVGSLALACVVGSPGTAEAQSCPTTFAGPTAFATTGTVAFSVATADLDNDGDQDAVVTNAGSNTVSVFLGNGAGGFGAATTFATGVTPVGLAVIDATGDGNEDVLTTNLNGNSVSLLTGNGAGGFLAPVNIVGGLASPIGLVAADLDGDGDADFAVSNDTANTVRIFLNNGAGVFAFFVSVSVGSTPGRLAAGDLDGDFDTDLVVANNGSDNVTVLTNSPGPVFATAAFPAGDGPRAVAIADLDRNNTADLVVALDNASQVVVLLGDGVGGFTAQAPQASGSFPRDIATGDVNGDAIEDVIVADGAPTLWKGNGLGGIASPQNLTGGPSSRSAVIADVNLDQRGDVLVADDTSLDVYLNTSTCDSVTAPQRMQFHTTRAGDQRVELELQAPHTGPYAATQINFTSAGAGPCVPPATPAAGTPLVKIHSFPGAKQTILHTGRTNGETYCYSAFPMPHAGSVRFGPPLSASGRAFDPTLVQSKWAYGTGATALGTPGVLRGQNYLAVSNDSALHGMEAGLGGGTWPTLYTPLKLRGVAQDRPSIITFSSLTINGASSVAFVGAQDGRVYATQAQTGRLLWVSPVLAPAIQASPSVVTTDFGGVANLVLVGTRDGGADNRIFALNLMTGAIVWTFDNLAGDGGFGVVNSQIQVLYPNRLVFTSHTRTSLGTAWCLQFNGAGAALVWERTDIGNVDNAPNVRNGVLYFGDLSGRVHALNAVDGSNRWASPYTTGDGNARGLVWRDNLTTRVYFSTNALVHAISDNGQGNLATPLWTSNVPTPSAPLATGTRVYVGGGLSSVYSIDAATGGGLTTTVLGDPTVPVIVGAPTFDSWFGVIVVGTEAGIIYAVNPF
jgi:outer membrane protein assembly factor BamB